MNAASVPTNSLAFVEQAAPSAVDPEALPEHARWVADKYLVLNVAVRYTDGLFDTVRLVFDKETAKQVRDELNEMFHPTEP